ncbi:MAG: hypothetical protein IKL82_04975 [Clostridia bacterium]|nr:hypothetical protein [Clostridia bacterium]
MSENYVKMLEIPVNSSSVVFKPMKKRKKDVKKQVIEKVNAEKVEPSVIKSETVTVTPLKSPAKKRIKLKTKPVIKKAVEEGEVLTTSTVKKGGFDIVSAQVVAVFVLIVSIILTNIFWEDSGMNVLFRSVFNDNGGLGNSVYTTFSAYAPSKTASVTLQDGVMTVDGGSVYSPCAGTVTQISEVDGLYTVTVSHSDSFSTVISGLENVYAQTGESVYENVPVGYSSNEIKVSMFSSDVILTGYMLSGNQIVWLG